MWTSFFNRDTARNVLNSAVYTGMLLTIAAAVTEGNNFWVMPESWTPPRELEGVDINQHPCALLCLEQNYRKALEYLTHHAQLGHLATGVLSYCAQAVSDTAAQTCEWLQGQPSGLDACLAGVPKEEQEALIFQLALRVGMNYRP